MSLLWDARYIWFNTVRFYCLSGNHRHVFPNKSANQLQLSYFYSYFAMRKGIRHQNSYIRLVSSRGHKAYPAVLSGDAFRDESFITSWGGGAGYIQGGGGRKFFWWCTGGGVENKMTHGQGGGHVFCQVLGGVRCVLLVFLFIKSHSFWGAQPRPPPPPISQLYNVRLSEPLGDIGNKICPILVKQKSFSSDVALCF